MAGLLPSRNGLSRMIKIQTHDIDGHVVLQVEGRLAGTFVPELENCWRAACANRPDQTITIDLKGVTGVDRAGRNLLARMYREGAVFSGAVLAISDILEQITGKATEHPAAQMRN